jgi:hypothetical protein
MEATMSKYQESAYCQHPSTQEKFDITIFGNEIDFKNDSPAQVSAQIWAPATSIQFVMRPLDARALANHLIAAADAAERYEPLKAVA